MLKAKAGFFMRKIIYIFAPIFILTIIATSAIAPTINMSEDISNKVFRLHIRANSDSPSDQGLKLIVRDVVLEQTRDIFNNCKSVDEALKKTNENIDLIRKTAEKTIKENGCNYPCSVKTDKEFFETRKYNDFTLPAGVYDSLIIEIGQGKGHNWWCVMFPAVCLSGCTEEFDEILTEEEREMIENDKYIVKFKTVEIIERIKTGANRIKG